SAVSDVTAQQLFATKQGGLLDIAIHPRFAENKLIYFTYAHGTQDANRTRVARAKFDGQTLSNWEVVFQVAQTKNGGQHFGSRLAWLPDETLLISTGDGGNPPVKFDGEFIRQQAQNPASQLGKVIRINDDGSIPADNPFVDDPDADSAVWSYGHRNIQGLAFDPVNQKVWATEHGSRGGDELNLIQSGENYGWPVVSFSAEYGTGRPVAAQTSDPAMTDPKRVWIPSIAPSGLAIYNGDRHPEWQGNIFAGGLVSKSIRRMELDAAGNVIAESRIAIGQRVRDIRQSPAGELYVLTDENAGQLLRLEP
ncbi:MAG: PQQ-dependent sugar dehydrogenase, partial [Limnothrix sp.]